MKRLDKLAQRTYLSLSAMEAEFVGGASGLTSSGGASISSPLSTIDTESRLPEWKFFNKVLLHITYMSINWSDTSC